MDSTFRVYVRTGIVGAWAVFVGIALVLTASRLLALFQPQESTAPLAAAGMPIAAILWDMLLGLYNGGAASVLLGILLVFLGWYQLLRMA